MSTVYDVAVVGSRGFLGSAIAAELERRGERVGRFTREEPYDGGGYAVVWAAGHVTPADTSRGDAALADLRALIDTANAAGTPPHIVLLSSGGAVYGPPAAAPFAEAHEPSPANEYGRIKLAEEQLLADSGLAHTALRVANPYGPAQLQETTSSRGPQGVIGAWMRAILAGDPVTLFGDGSTVRDYVFIDDLAAAVAEAAEAQPGGAVNLGSGVGTSLADLLKEVEAAVAPRPVTVSREPARGIDPPANWLDVSRAHERLGWRATTPLSKGLARTWTAVSA